MMRRKRVGLLSDCLPILEAPFWAMAKSLQDHNSVQVILLLLFKVPLGSVNAVFSPDSYHHWMTAASHFCQRVLPLLVLSTLAACIKLSINNVFFSRPFRWIPWLGISLREVVIRDPILKMAIVNTLPNPGSPPRGNWEALGWFSSWLSRLQSWKGLESCGDGAKRKKAKAMIPNKEVVSSPPPSGQWEQVSSLQGNQMLSDSIKNHLPDGISPWNPTGTPGCKNSGKCKPVSVRSWGITIHPDPASSAKVQGCKQML